jgi:hypothetical protein
MNNTAFVRLTVFTLLVSAGLSTLPATAETDTEATCPAGYETGGLRSLNLRSQSVQVEVLSPIKVHPVGYFIRLRVSYQKSAFEGSSPENTARIDVRLYDHQDDRKRAFQLSNQLGDEFSSRRVHSLCVRSLDPQKPHPNRSFNVRYGMELDGSLGEPESSL